MESVLLHGGALWDGSGRPAAPADVLVPANRIAEVWRQARPGLHPAARIDVSSLTVIPGLVDGHAHLPFLHKANIADTGDVPPEEQTLQTLRHAPVVLEAGFTSCLSGESAKPRLDVVLRNEINAGQVPGPRLLAASPDLTNTGNLGDERCMHIYRAVFEEDMPRLLAFPQNPFPTEERVEVSVGTPPTRASIRTRRIALAR